MIEQVNDQVFNQILQTNKIVVADFFAVWCGPCKMMHPIFEEIAYNYPEIKFIRVDIDENQDLAIKQNVQVVPTFIAYKDGKEINKIIGYNNIEDFKLFVDSLL